MKWQVTGLILVLDLAGAALLTWLSNTMSLVAFRRAKTSIGLNAPECFTRRA